MSPNKKTLFKTLLIPNAGCGCSRPKLSDAYEPKPKPKTQISAPQNPRLCSFSGPHGGKNALSAVENDDDWISTSFSFNNADTVSSTTDINSGSEPDLPKVTLSRLCPKIIDSIAVVKDSNDPYEDFRHSMLRMIVEKQIYSKDDLQGLLQCFLELNSPCHYDVIVKAFMEICNQVMISKEIVTVEDQEPCFVHHGGDKKPAGS